MNPTNLLGFIADVDAGALTIDLFAERKDGVSGLIELLVYYRAGDTAAWTYDGQTFDNEYQITVPGEDSYYVKVQDRTISYGQGGQTALADFDLCHEQRIDVISAGAPGSHASTHETGGADEVDLDGMVATGGPAASATIGIVGDVTQSAQLNMGDSGDGSIGRIEYDNTDDTMKLYSNNALALTLDDGDVAIPSGKKLTVETIQAVDATGIVITDKDDVTAITIKDGGAVSITTDVDMPVAKYLTLKYIKATDGNGVNLCDTGSNVKLQVHAAGVDITSGEYIKTNNVKAHDSNGIDFLDYNGNIRGNFDTEGLQLLPATPTILQFDSDTSLAADSNTRVPTQAAIKAYVDSIGGGGTLAGMSDTDITGPTSLDLLQWNGSDWVDRSLSEAGVASASGLSDHISNTNNPHSVDPTDFTSGVMSGVSVRTSASGKRVRMDVTGDNLSFYSDSTTEEIRLDTEVSGITTNPILLIASDDGAAIRLSENKVAFGEASPDTYVEITHKLVNIVNNDAGTTAAMLGIDHTGTGTQTLIAIQDDGSTEFELKTDGVGIFRAGLQLLTDNAGLLGHDGASTYLTTGLDGSDLYFAISGVDKATLDSSGNFIVDPGYIKTTGNYWQGAYEGVTGTFPDNNGNTVSVKGGIITAFT